MYADLRAMEAELAASATDWTSVRPPKLTDKPLTGAYRRVVGGNPKAAASSRARTWRTRCWRCVDDPATVKQGVGVAY